MDSTIKSFEAADRQVEQRRWSTSSNEPHLQLPNPQPGRSNVTRPRIGQLIASERSSRKDKIREIVDDDLVFTASGRCSSLASDRRDVQATPQLAGCNGETMRVPTVITPLRGPMTHEEFLSNRATTTCDSFGLSPLPVLQPNGRVDKIGNVCPSSVQMGNFSIPSSTNIIPSQLLGVSPVRRDPLFRNVEMRDDTSMWKGKSVLDSSFQPLEFNQTQWQLHQQNPSEVLSDIVRLRAVIDQCLSQDERCINIDEFLSAVPVGNYITTDQVFHLSPATIASTGESFDAACAIPESLQKALHNCKEKGTKLTCGAIPSLEIFWYVDNKTTYLWRWCCSANQLLELCFQDLVVAIGAVDPKFFLSENENAEWQQDQPRIAKLLLIATTSQMSLWFLRISIDGTSIYDAVPTSFVCTSPRYPVTTIVGHDESGRLFYGDGNGGVYEFVFQPASTSQESWASFFLRFSGWTSKTSGGQRTIPQKVEGSSGISKVLGRWTRGRQSILSLSFDSSRSLLYSVDALSNIDVFYLPPPDITGYGCLIEHPLQLLTSLSHGQIISQMINVYHQVIRASQQPQNNASLNGAKLSWDRTSQNLIEKCKVVQVVPLTRDEGSSVIAVALTSDSSRLFLRARLELPLLPKRLEATHNPEITCFQYIKSIDILNWKPPPPFTPHSDNEIHPPPVASQLFFNNRTFICAYRQPLTDGHSQGLLMCVTPDESDIYKRQTLSRDSSTTSGIASTKTLREWSQQISLAIGGDKLNDCEILSVYEEPLDSKYKQMLEGRGPLPDPFNVAGRCSAYQRVEQYERERIEVQQQPSNLVNKENDQQPFCRLGRKSISPWDIPTRIDSSSCPRSDDCLLGLGRVSSCHKYVPPSMLHSLTSTFTLPARVFIILTNYGVFRIQQLRFSDLYKNAAEELIRTTPTDRHDFSSSSSRNMIESVCTHLSSLELSNVQTILNSELRKSLPYPTPNLSLLNIFAAAQLFEPEQVMAAIWQILTLTYGKIVWPSVKQKLTSFGRDIKGKVATPFNRPERFDALSGTSYMKTSNVALNADSSALSLMMAEKAFSWSFLIEVLVTIISDPAIHGDPIFADVSYANTINSVQRGGSRVALDSIFSSPFGTSARLKGLSLFISRVLRPFWSTSIFEGGSVRSENPIGILMLDYPGVYRRPNSSDGTKTDSFGKISTYADERIDSVLRKRKRPEDDASLLGSPSNNKRSRNSVGQALNGHRFDMEEVTCLSEGIVLISRFHVAELEKAQIWLEKLEDVIINVSTRSSSGSEILMKDATGPQQEDVLRITKEIETLKSLALFCKIASQTLHCCSLLLSVTEGRELSAEIFDLLVSAPLSDLMCSNAHRQVLRELLTRQVLPPMTLRTSCDWIFGQEDLDLQCALQSLKALHQSIYQLRWRTMPFPDCIPIERNAAFRTAEVQSGIRAILTSAGLSPEGPARPELTFVFHLLSELQMFDVLAEFVARLAESCIAQHGDVGSTHEQCNRSTNSNHSPKLYNADRKFRKCLAKYYKIFEDLLDHYQDVAQRTARKCGCEVACELVTACLSLDVNADTRTTLSLVGTTTSSVKDPRTVAREWLHFVILDWINECGLRVFPVPLESVSSPVYPLWLNYHKDDLCNKALHILSEFFLKNEEYYEFGNFLIGVASKPWPDPQIVLGSHGVPNFTAKIAPDVTLSTVMSSSPSDSMSVFALDRHGSGVVGSGQRNAVDNLHPMSDLWTVVVNYIRVTQTGIALSERQRILAQAKDGLTMGLQKQTGKNKFHKTADQRQLRHLITTVNRLLDMVSLQIALVRESIEIAIFLIIQSSHIESRNSFSSDESSRKTFLEKLKSSHKNEYTRILNIQALLYVLQWKIYDASSVISILRELEEAVSTDKYPVPGLALITSHALTPNIIRENSAMLLDRTRDAAYCRSVIAIQMVHPELIEDFVSKYLLMVLSEQTSTDKMMKHSSENFQIAKILLNGIMGLILELQDAASGFKALQNETQRSDGSVNWELYWWKWPSCIICQQLSITDNFLNNDEKLDEQNQLPVLKALVGCYQEVMFRHPNQFGLEEYHIYTILFDLQGLWLQQLVRISSGLAFIHLLGGDEGVPQPSASELGNRSEKLLAPLSDMFCRSPAKIQILFDKCTNIIKACQTALSSCKDWLSRNIAKIDSLLNELGISSRASGQNLTMLQISRQNFIEMFERVQHRLPIILQYQNTLQRVAAIT